jgi:hypothetical protein
LLAPPRQGVHNSKPRTVRANSDAAIFHPKSQIQQFHPEIEPMVRGFSWKILPNENANERHFFPRNFSRVTSGPELGAYYHEFFRRDRPQLAAQMFCKNPRTMLALAESKGKKDSNQLDGRSIRSGAQTPDLLRSSDGFSALSLSNTASLPSGIARLTVSDHDKLSDVPHPYGHHQSLMSLRPQQPMPLPSTQMLERQILLLQQQEEANRLLLERALLLRQQRQTGLAGYANPTSEEQKLQDEQSLYLRLLMGLPGRTKPSNNRASAA